MTLEKVKEFMELINKDEELQKKVKAAAEFYTGDKADEKAVFEAVLAPVAKDKGYDFTYEELAELAKRVSDSELSEEELTMAAGGNGCCMIFGLGYNKGKGSDGAGYCAGGLGFGWGYWE